MTYNEWLETEVSRLERGNKILLDKSNNLETMFNEVYDNELETKEKKKEILKWAYSLEKENKELKEENEKLISNINLHFAQHFELQTEKEQLKQRISKLVSENVKLQNDLFSEQLIQDETEDYINRLKKELFNLYLKHYT